jgi:hypothetical protein
MFRNSIIVYLNGIGRCYIFFTLLKVLTNFSDSNTKETICLYIVVTYSNKLTTAKAGPK